MNKKLLTVATLTLLLAGQAAVAKDDPEEFLSWLNEGQDVVTQPLQYNKVSIRNESYEESNYDSTRDIFSIDFMSDK